MWSRTVSTLSIKKIWKACRLTFVFFSSRRRHTRSVTVENGKLFNERNGKKEELFPETSDLFFRKGVEGRILFHYDATGKVDSLIDRRNNEDVIWKKMK